MLGKAKHQSPWRAIFVFKLIYPRVSRYRLLKQNVSFNFRKPCFEPSGRVLIEKFLFAIRFWHLTVSIKVVSSIVSIFARFHVLTFTIVSSFSKNFCSFFLFLFFYCLNLSQLFLFLFYFCFSTEHDHSDFYRFLQMDRTRQDCYFYYYSKCTKVRFIDFFIFKPNPMIVFIFIFWESFFFDFSYSENLVYISAIEVKKGDLVIQSRFTCNKIRLCALARFHFLFHNIFRQILFYVFSITI